MTVCVKNSTKPKTPQALPHPLPRLGLDSTSNLSSTLGVSSPLRFSHTVSLFPVSNSLATQKSKPSFVAYFSSLTIFTFIISTVNSTFISTASVHSSALNPQVKNSGIIFDISLSFHSTYFYLCATLTNCALPSPNTSLLSSSTACSPPVLTSVTPFYLVSIKNPNSTFLLLLSLPELPHSTAYPSSSNNSIGSGSNIDKILLCTSKAIYNLGPPYLPDPAHSNLGPPATSVNPSAPQVTTRSQAFRCSDPQLWNSPSRCTKNLLPLSAVLCLYKVSLKV